MELSSKAEPRVELHSAAVADAVCELVDTVTPTTWSTAAVEDATDAVDMLTVALAAIDPTPHAPLRPWRPPPPNYAADNPVTVEDVATVSAPRVGCPRLRSLGPGWKGINAAPALTMSAPPTAAVPTAAP
ncbi:hypothetical protein BIV25_45455 [Streptomyces sp. MUSC 14]|uniref:hypothetical protein n=1 Tax=Streptomyces sp. MUSC 14 TaxID=1354889 RepID=UPI0008F5A74D|nr:hypothetical protein [Streptomyces sp. MUSC 14]OIJ84933.1 hypothetical protein BIV25_45455 [Streptomyces sp. MUSC 14]